MSVRHIRLRRDLLSPVSYYDYPGSFRHPVDPDREVLVSEPEARAYLSKGDCGDIELQIAIKKALELL